MSGSFFRFGFCFRQSFFFALFHFSPVFVLLLSVLPIFFCPVAGLFLPLSPVLSGPVRTVSWIRADGLSLPFLRLFLAKTI